MKSFIAAVAVVATANAALSSQQQTVCDNFKTSFPNDTTSDLYKAACDEDTINSVDQCAIYKGLNPDDTTSDAYKAVCDAASALTMGAAIVAAAAALAF